MKILELQRKAKDLTKELHNLKHDSETHAYLLGMAQALLTEEQLETMVSYLEKWIAEKAEKEGSN